jgi:hypothetical protein
MPRELYKLLPSLLLIFNFLNLLVRHRLKNWFQARSFSKFYRNFIKFSLSDFIISLKLIFTITKKIIWGMTQSNLIYILDFLSKILPSIKRIIQNIWRGNCTDIRHWRDFFYKWCAVAQTLNKEAWKNIKIFHRNHKRKIRFLSLLVFALYRSLFYFRRVIWKMNMWK